MEELTSKERISRILKREPVDRVGVYEAFWADTKKKWVSQGQLNEDEELHEHFQHDIRECWPFKMVADVDFEEEIIEETDETKLVRDGNGALLRRHKLHASTPEHVDFLVKDRAGWEEHIRPHIIDASKHAKRLEDKIETYRKTKEKCEKENLFFAWAGVNVFELMHPVCGHENMLVGMALDPDWIRDMCRVYTDLTINLMEILFEKEGKPDAIWFFEDLGFKHKPFMSPAMYDELIFPSHKRSFDYAHSLGLPVIVHSCGFVEPLVPGLIKAGMDCLQAMEVKAGMDIRKLKELYGDQIAFMGNMDVRTMVKNDRDAILEELNKKLPAAMEGGGYCLHSDHSIPDQVEYDTYKFFMEKGLEIGTYR